MCWRSIAGIPSEYSSFQSHRAKPCGRDVDANAEASAFACLRESARPLCGGGDGCVVVGGAGLVTLAARAGAAAWQIKQQTGHKSDAVLARYIRDSGQFADNVAKLIFK